MVTQAFRLCANNILAGGQGKGQRLMPTQASLKRPPPLAGEGARSPIAAMFRNWQTSPY
jgi:hypothetical protein